MGRFDWELSGPMQILLKSCSLILFTYDKTDPKRVSACGCVAVTTSLRCIWKNRSTQNWLKLSATEPQAVNKSHRKDVAPGAGLSYPALARRTLICGRGQGILYNSHFLSRPGCWQGKHTLTIFSDSSRVHAGPPSLGSNHSWQQWNSNPRLHRDWSLNPAP